MKRVPLTLTLSCCGAREKRKNGLSHQGAREKLVTPLAKEVRGI